MNNRYFGKASYGAAEEDGTGPAFAIIAMTAFALWLLKEGIETAGAMK